MPTIRDIEPRDEAAFRELWQGYLEFYETSLPEVVTESAWERIIGEHPGFSAIVAEDGDGVVIGFATIVLHEITWTDRPVALLHDLFVRPDRRGGGTGRALIQEVIDRAKERGWSRVYWMTEEDNAAARRLYDTFTEADGFVRYRVMM